MGTINLENPENLDSWLLLYKHSKNADVLCRCVKQLPTLTTITQNHKCWCLSSPWGVYNHNSYPPRHAQTANLRWICDFVFGAPEIFAIVGIRSDEQGLLEQLIHQSLEKLAGSDTMTLLSFFSREEPSDLCEDGKLLYHVHGQKFDATKINTGLRKIPWKWDDIGLRF